jgi:hypothetical protein
VVHRLGGSTVDEAGWDTEKESGEPRAFGHGTNLFQVKEQDGRVV